MSFCNFKAEKSDEEDFIFEDSFSSDYNDAIRSNSSSSIKWSVDARKQNEEDWLSIERILYGEESLPEGGFQWYMALSIRFAWTFVNVTLYS